MTFALFLPTRGNTGQAAYKCVGGGIYTLQAAGFQTIHFVAGQHGQGGTPAKAGVQTRQ